MSSLNNSIKILVLLMLLFGCKEKQIFLEEARPSNRFEDILSRGNLTILDLDSVESRQVNPTLIIDQAYLNSVSNTDTIVLGIPRDAVVHNDTMYIVDSEFSRIVELPLSDGNVKYRGTEGKGPGEFLHPFSIYSNGKSILINDIGNNRLQILSKQFDYEAQIIGSFSPFSRNVIFNLENLLVPDPIVPQLVDVYNLNNLINDMSPDSSFNLLPFYDDVNLQVFNTIKFYKYDTNQLVYYYISKPFVILWNYILDDYIVIQLKSQLIDQILKQPIDDEQGGVKIIIQDLAVMNDDIILVLLSEIILLKKIESQFVIYDRLSIDKTKYTLSEITLADSSLYTYQYSKARILKIDL